MIKKLIFSAAVILAVPAMVAYAATPVLTVTGNGGSDALVQISGGEISSPATLYFFNPSNGLYQGYALGSTNASGTLSSTINVNTIGTLGGNLSRPVYVQVGGYQSSQVMWPAMSATVTGGVAFTNAFPNIAAGQNGTVILSGGNGGTFYVASNSNASAITPTIAGNVLTLQGVSAGQANIVVCSTGGGCGTIAPTVFGTGSPTLSQSSLSFTQGNQGTVAITNGVGPFTVQIPSGSGISTVLTGNTLSVTGNATGTTMLNVCSSNTNASGQVCTPLTVTIQAQSTSNVTANNSGNSTSSTSALASQFNFTVPLTVGQALSFNLGGNGTFFLQSPMMSPVLASINDGNRLMLNGSAVGSGTVTVCQNGGSCFPVNFVVNPSVQTTTDVPTTFTGTGGGTIILVNLGRGASGPDVVDLQTRLKEEGYFHAPITGRFGGATMAAVKRYQRDHHLSVTGYAGAQTRAMLNQ